MNLKQARQLIGKYVEITQVSLPFIYLSSLNHPQIEYNKEGFIHEVIINQNVEGLRFVHDNNIIPLNTITRYRVYEPGEWQQ